MPTRSVAYIHDGGKNDPVICAVQRQFDGYPSVMGNDIAKALGDKRLVSGISPSGGNFVNGMGCAAAQLIAHLKTKPGSIYIVPADTKPQEYNYHIYFEGDQLNPGPSAGLSMRIFNFSKKIWCGKLSDFDTAKFGG